MPLPDLPADSLANAVLSGDRLALSRAITLVESHLREHRSAAHRLIDRVLPHSGGALRIGITGSPGAGKSTFIEAFGQQLIARGHRVAVLAVDPTSSRSGGSILGDKTRMEALARHPSAFIRPSPAGTALGGVHRATRESLLLCEAAGFDRVLVETVGVGQSETAVRSMVDCFLLLQLPGAGDDLQGIKRGIIEMADLIVVTKADTRSGPEALQRARRAQADLRLALHMFPPPESGIPVEVLLTSALEGTGMTEVADLVSSHQAQLLQSGYWQSQRRRQQLAWFEAEVLEAARLAFEARLPSALREQLRQAVAAGQLSPAAAAEKLLAASR